jgi:site-specific recombinase XerD
MKKIQNTSPELSLRQTITLKSTELSCDITHPEKLLVVVVGGNKISPYDIGSWCYKEREQAKPNKKTNGDVPVLESSFVEARRELIWSLLDMIIIKNLRPRTILSLFNDVKLFMAWIDDNGHDITTLSDSVMTNITLVYTDYLLDRIHTGSIKLRAANKRQYTMLEVIRHIHKDLYRDLLGVVQLIQCVRNPIVPPRESLCAEYVKISHSIINSYEMALMKNYDYPLFFECDEFKSYVYPFQQIIKSPHNSKKLSAYYDFLNGKKMSVVKQDNIPLWQSRKESNHQAAMIKKANNGERSRPRIELEYLVLNAYYLLFAMITGANTSEISSFKVSDVDKSNIKKELTAIKYRAKGKLVSYTLGIDGMKLLSKYMKFRKLCLHGQEFEYLFFDVSFNNMVPRQSNPSLLTEYRLKLKGVYLRDDIEPISASAIRKSKNANLKAAGAPTALAATLLNHTPETNIKSYSHVSVEKQEEEFSNYWTAVSLAAKKIRVLDDLDPLHTELIPTASGHCDKPMNPMPAFENPPIEPDCGTQYGCLYCEHYICHADEEDIHKLLSLRFVLQEIQTLATDIYHVSDLFRDLEVRIEAIMDHISSKSIALKNLVSQQRKRVFELGILTSFWENRLDRFEANIAK